jgi:hypothetical protein
MERTVLWAAVHPAPSRQPSLPPIRSRKPASRRERTHPVAKDGQERWHDNESGISGQTTRRHDAYMEEKVPWERLSRGWFGSSRYRQHHCEHRTTIRGVRRFHAPVVFLHDGFADAQA